MLECPLLLLVVILTTRGRNTVTYPLHDAAFDDNEALVRRLLDVHPVDARDDNGNTPLHRAARAGAYNIVSILLQNGADANAINELGETPLHMAAYSDCAETIDLLQQYEAGLDIQDSDGQTPLHNAAADGSEIACELLLAAGANRFILDINQHTAYELAIENGHEDIVALFENRETNIERVDNLDPGTGDLSTLSLTFSPKANQPQVMVDDPDDNSDDDLRRDLQNMTI